MQTSQCNFKDIIRITEKRPLSVLIGPRKSLQSADLIDVSCRPLSWLDRICRTSLSQSSLFYHNSMCISEKARHSHRSKNAFTSDPHTATPTFQTACPTSAKQGRVWQSLLQWQKTERKNTQKQKQMGWNTKRAKVQNLKTKTGFINIHNSKM